MKLTIGHLYPDLLNLYGDRGDAASGVELRQRPLLLNWGTRLIFPDWILCYWAVVPTGSRCWFVRS